MRPIILSILLAFCASTIVKAQDDVLIQTFASLKKWEQAKAELDKQLSNPKLKEKDKPVLLLWKIEVNQQLYTDKELYVKYPDADQQASSGLDEYVKLDPSLKLMKDQSFTVSVNNFYLQSFSYAKDAFNGKDWNNAYKYFSTAYKIGTFLNDNGLTGNKILIDTVTVLYTAYAAQNAAQGDVAIAVKNAAYTNAAYYYKKIADLNIGGTDYEDVYKFLLDYYSNVNKDDAAFSKYLATAKELYPNDNPIWNQFEMNKMTSGSSITELLNMYNKEREAGTLNEDKLISFAQEFATTDTSRLTGLDSATKMSLKKASAEAFGKAYEMDNTQGLYAFNTGVVYYSIYSALDDRYISYRGAGKDLAAKRSQVEKDEKAYADTSIIWLENAYTTLKANTNRSKGETSSLNRAVDYLANLYIWKRDKTKVAEPKNYDVYDAKYKQYDAEHASFK